MGKKISITIKDITQKQFAFTDLEEFMQFMQTESLYWKEAYSLIEEEGPQPAKFHPCTVAYRYFDAAINDVKKWPLESIDQVTLDQNTNRLHGTYAGNFSSNWIWSGHPYSQQFIECHRKFGSDAASGFIQFVVHQETSNLNNRNYFIGSVLGYEFVNQGSELADRSKGEKTAFDHLREQLSETTSTIIKETENLKESNSKWDEKVRDIWTNWIVSSAINHGDNQDTYESEFADFMEDSRERRSTLEKTYEDLLRLQEPAKYWNKAARKFKKQGEMWSTVLVVSVAAGLGLLAFFFVVWLMGLENKVQLDTVKGVILFGSILAAYAFLIKSLSRLTFSSFHLMRDAEEREQLTYLYLALSNQGVVDESSREIVLQALFSRSETGLLASESGPTMPGIHDLIKETTRHR